MSLARCWESVTFEFAETNIKNCSATAPSSTRPNRLANGEVVGIAGSATPNAAAPPKPCIRLTCIWSSASPSVLELTPLNDQLLREIDERRRVESRLREAGGGTGQPVENQIFAAVATTAATPNAARLFTGGLLERREPCKPRFRCAT